MPALNTKLKRTTAIIPAIQECHCGTRIDVSRFEAMQELTCPGCSGKFVVQSEVDLGYANAAEGTGARILNPAALRRPVPWKKVISTGTLVLLTLIAFNMVRKARARNAVSPIPQLTRVESSSTDRSAKAAAGAGGAQAQMVITAGVYKLKNRETNQVVDVAAWNSNNDARIQTWTSGGGLNQRWIIRPMGAGYQLIALHSCKALEVLNGAKDDATPVRQGTLTGGTNQIWNFQPTSDGFLRIVANCSGKALTVLDVAAKTGAAVVQRAVSEIPAQQWKLESLGGWPAELNPILDGRPPGTPPAPTLAKKAAQPNTNRFVPISLAGVANCDSRTGTFSRPDSLQDTVRPLLTGLVEAGGAIFDVLDAGKSSTGRDLLILKGGMGPPKSTYPKKVEVPVNGAPLKKLHFLGGVGGWGFPWDKTDKHVGVLAAQVTVVRKGGAQQVFQFRNGVEFADYHTRVDVPGSAYVEGFADYARQARYFTRTLSGTGPVEKLIIESFETNIAPVFIAVTGEVGG